MRTHRTAATLAALVSLALVAGCSDADETTPAPTTPSVTAAPAPAEPTTATASPEPDEPTEVPTDEPTDEPGTAAPTDEEPPTADPRPTSPTVPAPSDPPGGEPTTDPPVDGLAVPEGSGCTPGEGPLPDGLWYGEVGGADPAGVQFDLMCFFLGEEADKAALEDGEAMVPVPNGYYVRNEDPTARTYDVAGGTQVLHYPTGDPGSARVLDYREWAGLVADGQILLGVWLTVEAGAVMNIEEQWTP